MAGTIAALLLMAPATAGERALPDGATAWKPSVDWVPKPFADAGSVTAPTFEALQASIGADDKAAALEALQRTLDEVGDGAAYVWHRQTGPLWGLVRPYASKRNAAGWPCRRLHIALSLGEHTRTTDVTACRAPDKRWWLA